MISDIQKIPEGWTITDLGILINKMANGTNKKQNKERKGIPVTRIETISHEKVNMERVGYIDDLSQDIIDKYRLFPGDILFSNINSDFHLGKTAIFQTEDILLHGMNLLLIRPNQDVILPNFLNYVFNYYRISGSFILIAQHAVNQSSINQTKLKKISIPLPPINEQKRIVYKVEELFTKLDTGINELKQAKEKLNIYRQSILNHAFEGKLTEEWREHHNELEPANILLERAKNERKKSLGKQYKETSFDYSELPILPKKWAWAPLGEIIEPSKERYNPLTSDEEIFIGLKHIEKNTGKILSHGSSLETKSTKTKFNSDDVLYGRLRPYLNKVCVPEFEGVCSTDILVFSSDYIESHYLARFLATNQFVSYATNNMSGVQHPRIKFNAMYTYLIPLAPITEQIKIIEEIETTFSIIDNTEKIIDESLEQAQKLRQSILKKAFEGRLVSQDSADEPAEKLLERIKAEIAKQKPKKKVKSRKKVVKQARLV